MNLHKWIDKTKSNDVMYVFAQTNPWNKIEQCYVCICTNKSMKQNRTMLCMQQIDETKSNDVMYAFLHKQIDETKCNKQLASRAICM